MTYSPHFRSSPAWARVLFPRALVGGHDQSRGSDPGAGALCGASATYPTP